jgi:ribonuclease R
LSRAGAPLPPRVVAEVGRRGRFLVAEPLFERGAEQLAISGGVRVRGGEMVVVERQGARASVIAEIGDPSRPRDVAAALIWERAGARGFSPELEREAGDAVAGAEAVEPARRDLTALDTFTVDPATARDFDDAVSASLDGDGIRIWVHIADVAAHVRPGSGLEREAARRANSTYVPGTVEPMLPLALSADACSLAPGVERLAVTTEILLAGDGTPRSASFYRSRIRSDHRLSYDELDEYFAGRARPPQVIAAPLELARRAAATLADRRRGSALEVSTAEPEFEFDADGGVVRARAVEQTEAHRLIEQLMICANERVADHCERRKVATIYRVHERPDPARVADLIAKLAALDVPTPPLPKEIATISPSQAGEIVAEASRLVTREAARRGHGRAAYTSLVLRSLKPAVYSDRNLGHAGLGSPAYSHFTSPIRRFPDLIAHRALLSTLGAGEAEPERAEARDAAIWCSERERESTRIERDADQACAAFLLERELFEAGPKHVFEGEVSGVIAPGAFVSFGGALGDVYEGFLPARRLRGERFELDQSETAIVGARSGKAIRLGDPVSVRVVGIEAARGRVDLVPAGEVGEKDE